MEKYYLRNWRTFPFKEKSFEKQLDRYAIATVRSVNNPNIILDVVPIWGRNLYGGMGKLIDLIYQKEQGFKLDNESLQFMSNYNKPIDGEFVEMKSYHGPLFRIYRRPEAEYGLCSIDKINKPERDAEGNIKIYDTIKVFTWSRYEPESQEFQHVKGWLPDDMYSKLFCYRYFPMSMIDNYIV